MTTTYAPVGALGADEPRARFYDLVAAEWIKLRSLRSTWIAYGATTLAVIAFNAGTAYDTYNYWPDRSAADRADYARAAIPLQAAFTANAAMVMMLALGALGAIAIIGEYSTGTIRTTFAAVPARRSVMAAKTVVVTAVTTVFGAIVAGASFGLTQAILDGRDAGISISYPGALRVVVASALLAPVCAVVGMAIGSVIRHTSATMIASVTVILVLPIVFTDGRHWSAVAGHATLYQGWLRLVEVGSPRTDFPWTTGGAWTVYAVWALTAAVLAVTSAQRRDQ
ncbi:ABC transporter permease [Streptomyces sp. NBC_00513]|uniref:ABC transporter permease subunit n=1 Tax=unclassified Streptomyces TaxID=2593676 RepID=UPI00224FF2D6|nr:ABC transporter permease subunit [Streptomyces sp. NBC_00424]MCX5079338.1 ABC transporter permease [Streptomyces sp. NBC_00424]WUD39241.1 ABC transporter permease [Streptomyces sp. NBC_00513]